MKKIKFKNLMLMLYLPLALSLMSCDRPYLSGPIEIDFHNTTWVLKDAPNLGAIHIKEGEPFCIDRPLAEKLYPKSKLERYRKSNICGKYEFDKENRMIYFDLAEYSKGATVLRVYPNGDYFIPVIIGEIEDDTEGVLIQKKQ